MLVLGNMGHIVSELLARAGCARADLEWACLPFNQRFPIDDRCVLLPFGRFRKNSVTDALLRFQRIASYCLAGTAAENCDGQQRDTKGAGCDSSAPG